MEPKSLTERAARRRIKKGSVHLVTFRAYDGSVETRPFRIHGVVPVHNTFCLSCDDRWLPIAAVLAIRPYRENVA
jgi:hypothetical protein